MQLIDSHCHLNYDYAPKTADDLIREAKAAGITALVTIGTDLQTISEVQSISEKYEEVYHTIGVHPHDASSLSDADSELLLRAAKHPKCRGIGEIGLDYHYDNSPREIQKQRLEQQLEIALELAKPIVIHSRDGEEDLLRSLTSYAKRVPTGSIPGVIHCFTGTEAFGRACLDLGFYISFSGIITFKKADEVRACVAAFPLEKLLVETDSPFLAPIPHRGKKCEPAMVKLTAMKIAEVKGVDLETVARVTTENAKRVFRIG
jgi:TatD DNase family protein